MSAAVAVRPSTAGTTAFRAWLMDAFAGAR
jgi:hypothetical protein